MNKTIKIKRGLKANLPAAGVVAGELKFTTDTKELFIGDGTDNILINKDVYTKTEVETAIAALQGKRLQVVGFYDSDYPSLNRLTFPTSQTQIIFFGYKYDSNDPIKGGSVPLFSDNIMEIAPNSANNEYFRVEADTSGNNTVLTIYQNLMSYVRFLVVETNVDLTVGA